MLNQLTIQNFGLIDKTSLEFDRQLNILTGETGAGKSILIDALRCVLGERMDSSFIRDPQKPCTIEAVFDLQDKSLRTNEILTEYLTSDDDSLILQRTLAVDGKSKIKVNGMSVTVGQLKEIGNHLIDFHGPHDHQKLLSEEEHIGMLDRLADLKSLKETYANAYHDYIKLTRELNSLTELAQTRERELDLLTHEVKELESVALDQESFDKNQQEQVKIANSERLHTLIQQALTILEDEDTGIAQALRKAFTPLRSLTSIDTQTTAWLDQLTSAQENTNDLIANITDYADSLQFDPEHAEKINIQADSYRDILRKFGPTLQEASSYYQTSKSKLDLIKNFAENDSQLRDKITQQEKALKKIAQQITKARHAAGQELNTIVERELKDLGINHVQFDVRLTPSSFNADGADQVAFYISPNAGEVLKPLAQIVSSGEAARVMLALKKALVKVDPIPVLIFDEVDAQIGGRLGSITGKKLKELSRIRQTILITHLPQIASFADKHFKVIKSVKASRAITDVIELDAKSRETELAQMMSGTKVTDISLTHAKDMLAAARKS